MIAYHKITALPKDRQKSPLEEGVWFMPANCTDVIPPEFDRETHACSFDGSKWVVVDIDIVPSTPEPEPISAIEQLRFKRNQLLAETDWMANKDVTLPAAWKTYRQKLRDLPSGLDTEDKVNNAVWPAKP